jgi:hypothetical protein
VRTCGDGGRSDAHALRARAAGQRGPAGGEVRLAAARDKLLAQHGAASVCAVCARAHEIGIKVAILR